MNKNLPLKNQPLWYVLIFCFTFVLQSVEGQTSPTALITSNSLPEDVSIPVGFQGNPIAFFDDFSWRSFIALVWPALPGQRGVADSGKSISETDVPLVFETLKSDWEIFQPNGNQPAPWNSYGGVNPGSISNLAFGDIELASFSKFGNLGQAGGRIGQLVGPLVAQNGTYLRFLTAFNEIEFNQILAQKLYFQTNLINVVFSFGALDVKSSWMDMTNVAHPERYYTRKAYVFNPAIGVASIKLVGLVGLHIVQKTPSRPQWIWSTFEQIDNVPPSNGVPMALNNGNGTSMPISNPIPFPPPPVPPQPFNVERKMPINPSTQITNQKYQSALKGANSVWQFYQLVMTQWPIPQPPNTTNVPPSQAGTPNFTFPGLGASSGFANTTMETFDQTNVRIGCMACHNTTKGNTDFLWSLAFNAYPPPPESDLTPLLAGKRKSLLSLPSHKITNQDVENLKSLLREQ